ELFKFNIIAGKDLGSHGRNHYGCGIGAGVQHDTFAQNLAWKIIPRVMPGIAAEAIDPVLIIFSCGNYFGAGTLIPENAEIVSDLHALSRSQIDVHRVPTPRHLRGVPAADNHGHRLAAYRR